jgi:hypothetical protein
LRCGRLIGAAPPSVPVHPTRARASPDLKPVSGPNPRAADNKDCTIVRDYGLHLARKKFEAIPLLSLSDAQAMEAEHADYLRSRGYAVWQH